MYKNVISELMNERQMSYGELSKLTGIAKSTLFDYAKYENALDVPAERMALIAAALGTTLEKMYGINGLVSKTAEAITGKTEYDPFAAFDAVDEEIVDIILSLSPEKKQEALHYLKYLADK